MANVRNNLLYNFLGKFTQVSLAVIFTPIYLYLLGESNYGYVGLYIILTAWFNLLDAGLNISVGRYIALWSSNPDQQAKLAEIIRSGESIFCWLAICIFLAFLILHPLIIEFWINIQGSNDSTAMNALVMIGLILGLRLYFGFLSAVIFAYEDHKWLNLTSSALWLIQYIAMGVGVYFHSDVILFFFIQTTSLLCFLLLFMNRISKKLSPMLVLTPTGYYKKSMYRIWRFAIPILGASLLLISNFDLDKLMLSYVLTLEHIAYLAILILFINLTPNLIGILNTVFTPRLTNVYANQSIDELKTRYGKYSQLYIVLLAGINLPLACFSAEILDLLFSNPNLTKWGAEPLRFYAIGLALYGIHISTTPLFVIFEKGMKYSKYQFILFCIQTPFMYYAIKLAGVNGAAMTFMLFSCILALVWPIFAMRSMLPKYYFTWLRTNIVPPVITAVLGVFVLLQAKTLLTFDNPILRFIEMCLLSGTFFLALALSASTSRNEIIRFLRKTKSAMLN